MTAKTIIQRAYRVTVQDADAQGNSVVSYVPLGQPPVRNSGKAKQALAYRATVKNLDAHCSVTWEVPPVNPVLALDEFSEDASRRARLAHHWLALLFNLIQTVEEYVKELGWSTKKIAKPMEDSEIGNYSAPALLFQEETTKVLLEPIARSTPGTEGVVDFYLMPGYDDIASLYYYGQKWHLHYLSAEEKAVANPHEAEAKPLTKASLRKVLEGMKAHAQ